MDCITEVYLKIGLSQCPKLNSLKPEDLPLVVILVGSELGSSIDFVLLVSSMVLTLEDLSRRSSPAGSKPAYDPQ